MANTNTDDRFTQEECLALIEGVKNYELLYNPTHNLYKSKVTRERAWDTICLSVGKSAQQCKKKWRHLRDHYIRGHLKKGNSIENWFYYKPLTFLEVIRVKKNTNSVNVYENEEDEDDVFSESEDFQPKKMKLESNNSYVFENNTDVGLVPIRIVTEDENSNDYLNAEENNSDNTDIFMENIARRIKQLSPQFQDIAKVNILAHITELELQQNGL